jgi:hypothetical protein
VVVLVNKIVLLSVSLAVYLVQAISDLLKAQLQPLLNQYAMGIIQKFSLQHLTLGKKAPRFDGELKILHTEF